MKLSQEEIKEKREISQKASLGSLAALSVGLPISLLPIYGLSKYNGALSAKEIAALENAADNYLKNSKLNGVVKMSRIETVKPSAKELLRSFASPFGTKEQIKYGLNAAFDNDANEIILPKGKLVLSSFHEMGHALNYNFSKIGKSLQNVRLPLLLGAAAISSFALSVATLNDTKKKPAKGDDPKNAEQKESKSNKFIKFLKKTLPALPMVLMTPVVAEEALASFKGNNIAKEALKDVKDELPNLAKKVKLNNAIALTSYIGAGLLLSGVSYAAIKAGNKEIARQNNANNAEK